MRRVWVAVLCLLSWQLSSAPPVATDFNKAVQLAQLYKRPLILVFTGSDWCSWSQKLMRELFEEENFSAAIGHSFIFVHLDFPAKGAPNEQHYMLEKQYAVQSFPTLIMIEPDGKEVTRLSYLESAPEQFACLLKQMFSKFSRLQHEVAKIDLASAEESKLEDLYCQAVQLRCPSLQAQLLDQGLKQEKGVFFSLEKFSQLVVEGKVDTAQGEAIKRQILERDPEDRQGGRLRLALLDFQSHIDEPERAAKEPLSYLEDMQNVEDTNISRLHRVISEYFLEHGRQEEKKVHAATTESPLP